MPGQMKSRGERREKKGHEKRRMKGKEQDEREGGSENERQVMKDLHHQELTEEPQQHQIHARQREREEWIIQTQPHVHA